MTIRNTVMTIVIVCFVIAGGVAKAARYINQFAQHRDADHLGIQQVFASEGWHVLSDAKAAPGDPYPWLIFEKPSCDHDIMVSVLSANSELLKLVELYHHGDVTFVQNGLIVAQPIVSTLEHWLDRAGRLTLRSTPIGLENLPLLAVSPVPEPDSPNCQLPFARQG